MFDWYVSSSNSLVIFEIQDVIRISDIDFKNADGNLNISIKGYDKTKSTRDIEIWIDRFSLFFEYLDATKVTLDYEVEKEYFRTFLDKGPYASNHVAFTEDKHHGFFIMAERGNNKVYDTGTYLEIWLRTIFPIASWDVVENPKIKDPYEIYHL